MKLKLLFVFALFALKPLKAQNFIGFQAPQPFNSINTAYRVIDYNNDGLDDVISWRTDLAATSQLWRNNGNESFENVTLLSNFPSLAGWYFETYDFDRNGFEDAIAIKADTMQIYLNSISGFVTSSECLKFRITDIAGGNDIRGWTINDFNDDGIYDFIAVIRVNGQQLVNAVPGDAICACAFSFNKSARNTILTLQTNFSTTVRFADIDNDFDNDLLVATQATNGVGGDGTQYVNYNYSIYQKNQQGNYNLLPNSGYNVGRVNGFGSAGDLNNDGLIDIVTGAPDCCVSGNPLTLFTSINGLSFTPNNTAIPRVFNPYYGKPSFVDLNLDTYPDISWMGMTSTGNATFQHHRNNGNGTFTMVAANYGINVGLSHGCCPIPGSTETTLIDFNGDNKPDLDIHSIDWTAPYTNTAQWQFKNNFNNNSVKLKLNACTGVKEGWGSRISYKTGGNWINLSHTGNTQDNYPFLYLGMSSNTIIDSLIVYWKGGAVSVRTNITSGQFISISESDNCSSLTPLSNTNTSLSATITEGETYSFNGQNLTTAGTYTATLQNAAGCDSLITLALTVNPVQQNCEVTVSDSEICSGETVNISIGGFTPSTGTCSSENMPANLQQGLVAWYPFCGNAEDESPNNYNGTVRNAVPTADRFGNENQAYSFTTGQDIIVNGTQALNLYPMSISLWYNVDTIVSIYDEANIFSKYSPAAWNGYAIITSNMAPEEGNVYYPTVKPWYTRSINNRIIGRYGSAPFEHENIDLDAWHHMVFTVAPDGGKCYVNGELIATDTWDGIAGPSSSSFIWKIGGLYDYWYNGKIDDIAVYNRVLSAEEAVQLYQYQAQSEATAILWSTGETSPSISVSPTETTTYSVIVTQGTQTCTSDVTITVNQPSTANETVSACNTYTWNGTTYTESGTYTWTGTNAAGCDSVVTLNLTITPQPEQPTIACYQTATFNAQTCSWDVTGTQPQQPATACYETATFNAQTCSWDVTGTQPQQPATACYETATFNAETCSWDVSGTPSPAIVTNASACGNYTWAANGETYAASGQFSFNSNCQDYTLNLTINQSSASTLEATITEGESYSFNGQNLTAAGTYTATLQDASGCDSVVTLNLTVEPATEPLNCEIMAGEANVCAGEAVALNINGIANSTGLSICSVEALPENLRQGLVGFYPFCGNANDVSINANNGEVNGAVFSTDRFDNPGSSLELDGNDYVTIQPVSALNGLTNYTISAWIKQNNMTIGRGVIFSNWVNNTIPIGSPINNILWANQNRVQLALRAGQESTTLPISDFNNNWINITAVYDGSNTNALSRLKFYINGIETAIDCGFTSANCNHPSSLGLIANEGYIGARRVANSIVEYFNGNIDDLFLFNRSLSIEEVVQISSLSGNSFTILWSTGETTPSISVSPTETTTYSVTVTQGGQTCTSEVTITVNQPTAETVNATITEGENYSFNGQNLTSAGTYTATLQNAAGCDSVVTLNLSVNPAPSGCFAATFSNFVQGTTANGLNVAAIRSNAEQALNQPETVVDGVVNFVSLGFGGSITLAFETPVANGAGDDIRIDEATWGNNPCNRYPERADVFASQDGSNFVYLGQVCQDATLDLGVLSWAQFIRIVDASDLLSFNADADGFDVNGIECLNGAATVTADDGLVGCNLQNIVSYTPGTRKNGTPVPANRSDASKALGTPQNNNTINFVSLGFGGTLVAKFDYVVFNQAGNDLRVTETSFGNPSCANYPEKARISVSLDNINWVELGELCQDGEVDLGTLPYAQYIKIMDASPLSSSRFNGAADGYDVDAVVVLNNGCGAAARFAEETAVEETMDFNVYPNPIEDYAIISLSELDRETEFELVLIDAAGRIVMQKQVLIGNDGYTLFVSDLARGIYSLTLSNAEQHFVKRLVK